MTGSFGLCKLRLYITGILLHHLRVSSLNLPTVRLINSDPEINNSRFLKFGIAFTGAHHSTQLFTWVLGIQRQMFTCVRQMLYLLDHLCGSMMGSSRCPFSCPPSLSRCPAPQGQIWSKSLSLPIWKLVLRNKSKASKQNNTISISQSSWEIDFRAGS